MQSFFDLSSIVATVSVCGTLTLFFFLIGRSAIKGALKSELRANTINDAMRTLGFKNFKLTDLNKLTPEGFGMLRQLIYDLGQITGTSGASKGLFNQISQLQQLGQAMQGMNTQNNTKKSSTEVFDISGVKAE